LNKTTEAEALSSEYSDLQVEDSGRQELLDDHDRELSKDKNLSLKNLLYTYLLVILMLMVFIPKIIVANEVYKTSISIQQKEKQLEFLNIQKRDLELELQKKLY
jgi:cell division protein FtsL